MKLTQVLSNTNQIEKTKFMSQLDKLCSSAIANDQELERSIANIHGQIKNASNGEIKELFSLLYKNFKTSIQEQVALSGIQISLLIKVLARDGSAVARTSWVESLYNAEWDSLKKLSIEIKKTISECNEDSAELTKCKALSIYHDCLKEAFFNDECINREAKITNDERSILNVLSKRLAITQNEASAIEYLIDSNLKKDAVAALSTLRDMGVICIKKRTSEVLIADEIVKMLNEILGKELADKHFLRILRNFSDAELSNILKQYGKKTRGIDRATKIKTILDSNFSIRNLLSNDLFSESDSQNQRKERLKILISDLDLNIEKKGSTLNERIEIIINAFSLAEVTEADILSAAAFKELFESFEYHFPNFKQLLHNEFNLEAPQELNAEKLRSLNITPIDILYLLSNDQVKIIRDKMSLSKRGAPRTVILELFSNANDKLIENYEALACSDLHALKASGIDISEPEIGVKFEEVTKEIFEYLGLTVDEELRQQVNTARDKADIILSLSDDDIIIGEAKTCKNGDFAKYSSTSRQVKSYVSRYEQQGKRVTQVLIVAPSFSTNFIESAEVDTDINISLLEAKGLKLIYDTFKSKRNPNFNAKLLTKGGLLKTDLIAKNI